MLLNVAVRYRHNFTTILINPHGVVSGTAITGRKIPALLKDGEYAFREFGGAMDFGAPYQRVKLIHLLTFYRNRDGFGSEDAVFIPLDHYTLGYYFNERYYIALKDGDPIHWLAESDEPPPADNPIQLSDHR